MSKESARKKRRQKEKRKAEEAAIVAMGDIIRSNRMVIFSDLSTGESVTGKVFGSLDADNNITIDKCEVVESDDSRKDNSLAVHFDTYQCAGRFGCGRTHAREEIEQRIGNDFDCWHCGNMLTFVPAVSEANSSSFVLKGDWKDD